MNRFKKKKKNEKVINFIKTYYNKLSSNIKVENAYPAFYLFFQILYLNFAFIEKSNKFEMLRKAKDAVFTNLYGLSKVNYILKNKEWKISLIRLFR